MWFFILIAFLGFLGIGYSGSIEALGHAPSASESLNALYGSLQFFVVGGSFSNELEFNWQIQVARFGAPAITVLAFLQLAAQSLYKLWRRIQVRTFRNHIVLCGQGRMSKIILDSLVEAGVRVVVIDDPGEEQRLVSAEHRRVVEITGDPRDRHVLVNARVQHAGFIIASSPSDGLNVEIGLAAREVVRAGHRNSLIALIHLSDTTLAHRLRRYQKFVETTPSFEPRLFSLYENSARMLFAKYPPDVHADIFGVVRPHLVIAGFGQTGRQVAIEAARICHYRPDRLARITVLDPDAVVREPEFLNVYPEFGECAEIEFISIDLTRQSLDECQALVEAIGTDPVTSYIVSSNDDEESFATALKIRDFSLNGSYRNAPVFVAMRDRSGLAQVIESNSGAPETPDGLFPFGMIQDCLSFSNLLNQELDLTAQAIQRQYMEAGHGGPASVPWSALPLQYRDSNRGQGDHLDAKLRAIGVHPAPLTDATAWEWAEEEVDCLARMEHGRWCAERRLYGWRQDEENEPPQRFDPAMVHEILVPWATLPDKERVRSDVRENMPDALRRIDRSMQRDLVIGVAPAWPRSEEGYGPVSPDGARKILLEAIAAWPNRYVILLTALASSFERQLAGIALAEDQVKAVNVALPLPFELFAGDIRSSGGEEALESFRSLTGRSSRYLEMPLRFGSLNDLRPGTDERESQYALTGAYIVEKSDVLVLPQGSADSSTDSGRMNEIRRWWKEGCVDARYAGATEFFPATQIREACLVPAAKT